MSTQVDFIASEAEQEVGMRIELPPPRNPVTESSPQTAARNDLPKRSGRENQPSDQSEGFVPSSAGSSGTYSPASLRAAADCNAKYLAVAESNLTASRLPSAIPQALLDRLNQQIRQAEA
jgi:hypothetical protein